MLKSLFKKITDKLDHILQSHAHTYLVSKNLLDRQLLLSGQLASFEVRKLDRVQTLADAEFRVTSQWGEDGIIEWLCHKLPGIDRSFVEFGVENYGEANTRFLLTNRGWKGLIFDGNATYMEALKADPIYWMFDLNAKGAFITKDNINDLIREAGFDGDLGILSVDIDGNDYWVLEAIDCVKPAIIICEYNAVLGDLHAITIPYQADFDRLSAHFSGQYFGTSIAALKELAKKKGYSFVGTNSNGVNAFFVRDDLAEPVLSSIAEVKAWPARHRDSRDPHGTLTFTRGAARADLVKTLPVRNLANGTDQSIESLYPLYSDAWSKEM